MDPTPRDPVVLTERQRFVLWMVSVGYSQKMIARETGSTQDAIRSVTQNVRRILGANGSAHAVRIGLLDGHIGPYKDCGYLAAYRRHIKADEPICAACKRGNRERTEMEAIRRARPELPDVQVRLLRALHAGRSNTQIQEAWGVSQHTLSTVLASTYAMLGVDRVAPSRRREAALREATARGLLGTQPLPAVTAPRRELRLSPTQVRILIELEGGATVAEAAERIGISRNAAGSRLSEVYRRFGVTWMDKADRRPEAIRRARAAGLLPALATT